MNFTYSNVIIHHVYSYFPEASNKVELDNSNTANGKYQVRTSVFV